MDSLLDFDQEYLEAPWGPYGRDLTLGIVSLASKFILQVLNRTKVINHETYTDLVRNRPEGVGLLTISNHTRCVTGCSTCCAATVVIQQSTMHSDGCAALGMLDNANTLLDVCISHGSRQQCARRSSMQPVATAKQAVLPWTPRLCMCSRPTPAHSALQSVYRPATVAAAKQCLISPFCRFSSLSSCLRMCTLPDPSVF
jgi:hypothetical protein